MHHLIFINWNCIEIRLIKSKKLDSFKNKSFMLSISISWVHKSLSISSIWWQRGILKYRYCSFYTVFWSFEANAISLPSFVIKLSACILKYPAIWMFKMVAIDILNWFRSCSLLEMIFLTLIFEFSLVGDRSLRKLNNKLLDEIIYFLLRRILDH